MHDAGYDAFITGKLFNALTNFLKYKSIKRKKNNQKEKLEIG